MTCSRMEMTVFSDTRDSSHPEAARREPVSGVTRFSGPTGSFLWRRVKGLKEIIDLSIDNKEAGRGRLDVLQVGSIKPTIELFSLVARATSRQYSIPSVGGTAVLLWIHEGGVPTPAR